MRLHSTYLKHKRAVSSHCEARLEFVNFREFRKLVMEKNFKFLVFLSMFILFGQKIFQRIFPEITKNSGKREFPGISGANSSLCQSSVRIRKRFPILYGKSFLLKRERRNDSNDSGKATGKLSG